MSRSTQFIGLNENAGKWLDKYCVIKHQKITTVEINNDTKEPMPDTEVVDYASEVLSVETNNVVEGMFNEIVHTLREFRTKAGSIVEEYVQAEPWSSGPCIFLALRFRKTKEPIRQSLWSDIEIDTISN